ncbi:hypothetical protein LY78DRAFT_495443 [Colletotrichum sublineola]|nr:hypothetical protein LY78DRAFT_495443 [Colletotrichum sublineola]
MKLLFNTVLLITTFFLNPVLCTLAGNEAYTIIKTPSLRGGSKQSVFTSGYKNGRVAVLTATLDIKDGKIDVERAYNGEDKTRNRLHLNEMLKSLWEANGGQLHNLRSIEFSEVVNKETVAVIRKIKKRFRLGEGSSFVITEPAAATSAAVKKLGKSERRKFTMSWDELFQSPFGKVARRLANEGGNSVDRFELHTNTLGANNGPPMYIHYLTVKFS